MDSVILDKGRELDIIITYPFNINSELPLFDNKWLPFVDRICFKE